MGEAIAKVKNILSSAENGWIAITPTADGGGYSFFMKFDAAENVKMYADLNDASSTTEYASYYRVKQDQGVDLVFDTFNYITMLNDPDPATLGGNRGTGFKSDVDFIYDRSSGDSIIFTGKRYRQSLKMVKATATQRAAYESAGLKTAIDKVKSFFSTNKYPYIEIVSGTSTIKAGISINTTNNVAGGKRLTLTGVLADGVTTATASTKFAFTLDGPFLLGTDLKYSSITFVKILWKDASTLALYDSTGKEYIVKNSTAPLTPLYLLLGASYGNVVLPNATTYTGWGSEYISRRATAASAMLNGGYALRLEQMTYTFNNTTKKMTLKVNMPQNATQYVGTLNYTYTRGSDGIFKFTYVDADGNGTLIVPFMAALLGQRLNVNTFTVDYLSDPISGGLYAQFKSIENPNFTFSGALQ
ncbi:hypothetical protein AB669_08590 [Pedobacter sp. BMA]|nr:hypothetical protein AB669_08590 [Pedobacter sp. BMA]